MNFFLGREQEMLTLKALLQKRTGSFVVMNGRRRIGKSRLIKEFAANFEQHFYFTGLPPEPGITNQHQLDEFSRQLSSQANIPNIHYTDWGDAFWALSERTQKGRILVFFDEISWMGINDPTFLGKIKNLWDNSLSSNNKLVFVICGSASSWIQKNILSSTGFVGRISLHLNLQELKLKDTRRFWPKNISSHEIIKVLSITGGVPKYLEEVDPKMSAEANIKKLCFTKNGFLVDEFDRIFADLFLRESDLYKKIVRALADGSKTQTEICDTIAIERHGRIPEYLGELEVSGFVTRDYSWNIKTGDDIQVSKYRLSDNYLRFYLKYIEKNLSRIKRDIFVLKSLTNLPAWDSVMGLQFENLILSNREFIHKALGILPEEIITSNPYFQRSSSTGPGCQIDYMIQTKFNTLYVCEIKFLRAPVGISIIPEIDAKIAALKVAKHFSIRPVLIHLDGVTKEVCNSDFFASIIDANKLLER